MAANIIYFLLLRTLEAFRGLICAPNDFFPSHWRGVVWVGILPTGCEISHFLERHKRIPHSGAPHDTVFDAWRTQLGWGGSFIMNCGWRSGGTHFLSRWKDAAVQHCDLTPASHSTFRFLAPDMWRCSYSGGEGTCAHVLSLQSALCTERLNDAGDMWFNSTLSLLHTVFEQDSLSSVMGLW